MSVELDMTRPGEPQLELVELMNRAWRDTDGKGQGERLLFAKQLGQYGILSKRQVAAIVGLNPVYIIDAFEKESYHGGRIEVESLPLIQEGVGLLDADAERAVRLFYDAWQMGTSIPLLARLSGLTLNTLKGRLYKIRREVEGDE